MQETPVQCLGWENSLEKGKATHSSILAWRIPWTAGILCSIGLRQESSFILLHTAVQFSQHYLLKRLPFPHCTFLALSSITDYMCVGVYFWIVYSVPLILVYFMPKLSCFDYYNFVMQFAMRKCDTFSCTVKKPTNKMKK